MDRPLTEEELEAGFELWFCGAIIFMLLFFFFDISSYPLKSVQLKAWAQTVVKRSDSVLVDPLPPCPPPPHTHKAF